MPSNKRRHFLAADAPAASATLVAVAPAAAAPAEIAPLLEDTLACGICFHLLCRPITLRCGHSYCSSCIVAHERLAQIAACPSCRAPLGSSPPAVALQLDAFVCAARSALPGEVIGETVAEWKRRMEDWDERATAELAEWTGRGREENVDDDVDVFDGDEVLSDVEEEVEAFATPRSRSPTSLASQRSQWETRLDERPQMRVRDVVDYASHPDCYNFRVEGPEDEELYFRTRRAIPFSHMIRAWCCRQGVSQASVRFTYTALVGRRRVVRTHTVTAVDTVMSLGLHNDDCIDVHRVEPGT